jgi:hypothetical protein
VSSEPKELPLGRLEAFSDGVFAIAITLLVLELGVSATAGNDLLGAIVDEWPSYLAYVTSFLTLGTVWLQHSTITSALRAADAVLYRINLLVLLLASFLPFPTKLVATLCVRAPAPRQERDRRGDREVRARVPAELPPLRSGHRGRLPGADGGDRPLPRDDALPGSARPDRPPAAPAVVVGLQRRQPAGGQKRFSNQWCA